MSKAWRWGGATDTKRQKRPKSVATLSELSKTDKELLPSLSVHACHGLKRQLEIARTMIAKYLNDHQKTI